MNGAWWLDFFFYSSLGLNVLLCIVLGIVWWNTRTCGLYNRQAEKEGEIYVLRHPETKEIKYVGKTIQGLERRLSEHLISSKGTKVHIWIRELLQQGLVPIIEKVADGKTREELKNLEKEYIHKYINEGNNLLNSITYNGGGNRNRENHNTYARNYRKGIRKGWRKKGTIKAYMNGEGNGLPGGI